MSSFPVTSRQGSEVIEGVKTDFHISNYSDRTLVVVTQTGKPGTFIHVQRDSSSGRNGLSINVLVGKRDDVTMVYARQIAEVMHKRSQKPVLIAWECLLACSGSTESKGRLSVRPQ
mmetsp:Transcript_36886/g.115469  ORF Transcript_36886/g.115469 Transcript_36886/m.115469 type:complete len:116 (+) Transcript_36886:173-520(+)